MKNYLVKIRGGVEVDSAGKKAGKGPLIAEEISHTLGTSQDQYLFQAVEEKSKAIGVDFYNLDITGKVVQTHTAGRNDNHHDRADTAGCNGKGWTEDVSYTLNTIDRHAVAYRANAYDELEQTEKGATLKACGGNYGGGSENLCVERKRKAIEMNNQEEYIVRRLTPLECCRLQGFPDGWAEIDHKDDFTDEEYRFWLEVRNTFAEINGKQVKDYTKEQMLKWYNKLHTDSAEYKMWGNGIGLPNALYVMQGIVRETGGQNEKGLHTL